MIICPLAITQEAEMIRSFIMTAPTTTLKSNRKIEVKNMVKSKEHCPNPIMQIGLCIYGDGIPLAFSLFSVNTNELTSLKPLEQKVLRDFGCYKFIYCSDAVLGSESVRFYNHMAELSFIITQTIKKLTKEEKG